MFSRCISESSGGVLVSSWWQFGGMLVGGLVKCAFGVICVFADYFILDSFAKQIIYFFQSAYNIFYKKKKKKKKNPEKESSRNI